MLSGLIVADATTIEGTHTAGMLGNIEQAQPRECQPVRPFLTEPSDGRIVAWKEAPDKSSIGTEVGLILPSLKKPRNSRYPDQYRIELKRRKALP